MHLPKELEIFLNNKVNRELHPFLFDFLCDKEFVETKNLFIFFILDKNILDNAHFTNLQQKINFSDSKTQMNRNNDEDNKSMSLHTEKLGKKALKNNLSKEPKYSTKRPRERELLAPAEKYINKFDFLVPQDFSLLYHPKENLIKNFIECNENKENIMFLEELK